MIHFHIPYAGSVYASRKRETRRLRRYLRNSGLGHKIAIGFTAVMAVITLILVAVALIPRG